VLAAEGTALGSIRTLSYRLTNEVEVRIQEREWGKRLDVDVSIPTITTPIKR